MEHKRQGSEKYNWDIVHMYIKCMQLADVQVSVGMKPMMLALQVLCPPV